MLKEAEEWGEGKGKSKNRHSVRAKKVHSSQYKSCEQPWNFLTDLSAFLPKYKHQQQHSLQSMCPWDTVCVPCCKSLTGINVYVTETRKSWHSSFNITSEPDSLCPKSCSPQKAWTVSEDVASLLYDLKRHFSFIVDSSYRAG